LGIAEEFGKALKPSWLAQARDRSVAPVNGKRWLVLVGIGLGLVLGGTAVALLVVLPKFVEGRVLSTAAADGVTLEPKAITFGWGWVRLTQVKVTLYRVRSVTIQVGRIDVALAELTPTSIQLTNVEGQVLGSITNVGLELSEWTTSHALAYALPLSAQNVHATFIEQAGANPWLDTSGGSLTHTATGGVFAAEHARFLGVDLGKVGASFARESSAIALGFGEADLARAPFRVEVSPVAPVPTAKFSLSPIAAERLAKPLGVALPIAGVIVSSETTLSFPATGPAKDTVQGSTHITLKGYVPPHPFELDGFIFGDTTTFDGKFTVPALRDRITLDDAKLKAGAFELRGNGLLVRSSDHSQVDVTLHGQLPCSALASVTANSRVASLLGAELGAKAGEIAEKLSNGSVAVGLTISADTRNLAVAKLERTIGIGCGLRPLTLAELAQLAPLAPDLNAILQSIPTLPGDLSSLSGLPVLPSGLPPIPSGIPALAAGLPQFSNLGLPVLPPLTTTPPAATAAPNATTPAPKPVSTSASKAQTKPASSGGG
jgi:ADP-dependent NAD(P)H-hydrate dehydratase / NAD(P)H-hydrate epimerase